MNKNLFAATFDDLFGPLYYSDLQLRDSVIKDNKATVEVPGANKENLEVSSVQGVLSLSWTVGQDRKRRTFVIPAGREPTEVEVKDGIATISFAANEKKILVK